MQRDRKEHLVHKIRVNSETAKSCPRVEASDSKSHLYLLTLSNFILQAIATKARAVSKRNPILVEIGTLSKDL